MNTDDFWNACAALGETAGTQDRIARELEYRAIAAHVTDGMAILDVGCGNGESILQLCQERYLAAARGIDYSEKMIDAARANRRALIESGTLLGRVEPMFGRGNVIRGDMLGKGWDVAYTQRTIINCGTWEQQQRAIRNILAAVKQGGQYLMVENSADGLASINDMRVAVELPAIVAPWHNRYLVDDEVIDFESHLWSEGVAELECVEDYSGGYYFLSRVVNAYLASLEGKMPDYDAPVNQLALKLPSLGVRGQGRLWRWRRL